jgi:hypothetical protein
MNNEIKTLVENWHHYNIYWAHRRDMEVQFHNSIIYGMLEDISINSYYKKQK